MKQPTKLFSTALAVVGSIAIASSAQAQYLTGQPILNNVPMASGSFTSALTSTGLELSGTGYNWGEVDIASPVTLDPADTKIVMTYTINSPTPGTTGADYTDGNAWEWYALQPLLGTANDLGRYGGYDGYDLAYGFPSGQGVANQDAGYVYNNGVVTLTANLTGANLTDIQGGGSVYYFQISMDPTTTLPDGYDFTINSIELVAVPEPSTLALVSLSLGVVGLLIVRRRVAIS